MPRTRRCVLQAGGAAAASCLGAACAGPGGPEPATSARVESGRFAFLEWWSPLASNGPFMEEVTRRWRQRRPELRLEMVGAPPVAGVREKFVTARAAGDPFDATFASIVHGRDMYDQGMLMDLDGYIKRAPDVADGRFLQGTEQFRKTGGKTFGIPVMGPESNVIVVNSGLFESAGLDPRGKDLRTWDDLARIAQLLTQRRGSEVTRSGYLLSTMNLPRLAGWSNTTASSLLNQDQTKAFYTAPGVAQAMEYQVKLHTGLQVTHPLGLPDRPGGEQALLSGAAAMVDGISSAPTLWFTRAPEFKYWQVPYPQGPGGKGPNSVTWMNMVVFDKTARNAERAFEFVRWFCASEEVTVLKLEMTDAPSPVHAFFRSAAWTARVKENPVLQTRLDIAELTGVYPYRRNNDQATEINPLLQDALLGKLDIRNALQQAQAIADRVLAQ